MDRSNPFTGGERKSLALPEYAAMAARYGPPRFLRGHRTKLVGARDDAAAVKAWAPSS
jgi:hypothetical protein